MSVVVVSGLAVAGCGFRAGAQAVDAASAIDGDDAVDGPVDAGIDTPMVDANLCFDGFTRVCLAALPTAQRVITTDTTIDTAAGCAVTTMGTANGICVIAATTIEIQVGATLHTTGNKPLLLLATTSILVAGTLDAASHRPPGLIGPGAGPGVATCGTGTAPTATGSTVSGGGGYGGTFGTIGGDGGDSTGRGAKGVAPQTAIVPTTLRAGCAGVPGANNNPGLGGRGGGAIELLAPTITVAGLINASGAGGLGGIMGDSGGGGGGSGGMIVFDTAALTVTVTGTVVAQGGGGGGGSGNGGAGTPGGDPAVAGTAAAGGTGVGGGTGANSGAGGTGAIAAAGGDAQTGFQIGGGGGGGGAGFTKGPATAGAISPPFR